MQTVPAEKVYTLREYRERFVNRPENETDDSKTSDGTTAEAEALADAAIQMMVRQIHEHTPSKTD